MKKTAVVLALSLPLLLTGFFKPAIAHEESIVGDIRIVGGWEVEPPLLNQLNAIEIQVTRVSDGSPVLNAFAFAQAIVKKGGLERQLDIRPGDAAGMYRADIIPTQLGQYAIQINGIIDRQQINTQIEIEDVEDSRRLNFPDSGGDPGQGIPEDFIEQMRSVMTNLTIQVEDAASSAQDARGAATSAAESVNQIKDAADRAYLVGMVGIGVGAAGIAIAAVALSRKT